MSWATVLVWAVTFGLTVFADLTIAVEFGIVLAALMFIRKVANTTTVTRVTADYIEKGRVHILQDKSIPESVAVFRVQWLKDGLPNLIQYDGRRTRRVLREHPRLSAIACRD